MPERTPLGDDVVHVGGPEVAANGGQLDYGGPAQGDPGQLSMGAGSWSTTGLSFPASPSLEGLQVDPIVRRINYSAAYPANDGIDAWKGERPGVPNIVTGFEPKE